MNIKTREGRARRLARGLGLGVQKNHRCRGAFRDGYIIYRLADLIFLAGAFPTPFCLDLDALEDELAVMAAR